MMDAVARFPCAQCGADLKFEPGTASLVCPYCGHENPIAAPAGDDAPAAVAAVAELDYAAFLAQAEQQAEQDERLTVTCTACGAEVTLAADVTADLCPFCGASLLAEGQNRRALKPQALLPFAVEKERALELFRGWVAGRWFAPRKLAEYARREALTGLYIPYFTYDADTATRYRGERGEDYWDTETYTVTVNGRSETRTRQVRRTRWYPASGRVAVSFDDLLVLASERLPRKKTEALEPWDLQALAPFDERYLAGFQAERAQLSLTDGFARAREQMEPTIRRAVCRDIGGDHQRIHSLDTAYSAVTFKHLLLPIWLSSYRWREQVYRFVINGRTGEVQGERPWSWAKIAAAALGVLVIVGIIVVAIAGSGR